MSSGDKTTTAVHDEAGEGTGLGHRPSESAVADRRELGRVRVAAYVPPWQLNVLRAGYVVIVVGNALVKWPLLFNHGPWELKDGTVECMLLAMSVLALIGVRHPLRMLPILLFEVTWKLTWLGVIALPLWLDHNVDEATGEQVGKVLWVVVIIAVIPWRQVVAQYVMAPAEARRRIR